MSAPLHVLSQTHTVGVTLLGYSVFICGSLTCQSSSSVVTLTRQTDSSHRPQGRTAVTCRTPPTAGSNGLTGASGFCPPES